MIPPFFMGATLLFWGWQSDLFEFACAQAVVLEAARWVNWRWNLSDKELHRFADICAVLFAGAAFYLFSQYGREGLFHLLNWLPMLCFPLLFAQVYSTQGSIKLSSLFSSLRHIEDKIALPPLRRVDLRYPYWMICILSTSATSENHWFFIGTLLLGAWGLAAIRPQRYSLALWLGCLLLVGSLGFTGQLGLYHLQSQLEEWILNFFLMWDNGRDPYQQSTAIGDIGRLKESDTIILRVKAPHPLLLREASYNTYYNGAWFSKKSEFTPLTSQSDDTWILKPTTHPSTEIVKVSGYLRRGHGLLALPNSGYKLGKLVGANLFLNTLGTVKITQGPGLINYDVYSAVTSSPRDKTPTIEDSILPATEQKYLAQLTQQLNLSRIPRQAVTQISQFFQAGFYYSLQLSAPTQPGVSPLQYFLQQTHQGHCEYYASATVLLLRAAGIPARYAAGYAVQEYSNLENAYIVRKRHAHAWALAYLGGIWQEIDNTPSEWGEIETTQASVWQPLHDIYDWLTYKFYQWRWSEQEIDNRWLLGLAIVLMLILMWRLYFKERVQPSAPRLKPTMNLARPGQDSPFYQVLMHLEHAGYQREPGETLQEWLQRTQLISKELALMLILHQRYRFDASGLTASEQQNLSQQVQAWLATIEDNKLRVNHNNGSE
jgi:protein-glutamine gamma-glutamyltransferase